MRIKEQKQAAKSLARQKAKALDKEQREIENGQKQAAKSLARQKSKELGKYNGLSIPPQIAVKGLSEKINTSLTSGLTKAFGGKAMSGALSKSIVSGVSTAAAGAVVGAVAVGAAMVTLMLAPFNLCYLSVRRHSTS